MTTAMQSCCAQRTKATLSIVLAAWFALALGGSLAGWFQSEQRPPIPLGLMAAVPVAIFALAFARSGEFRRLVLAANPRLLTAAQSGRVVGIVFVVLYYRGALPGTFALPAGWGDVAIGVTAPLVAWLLATPAASRRRLFVVWNLLGILDLVLAVTLGVLSSDSPIGILAQEVTTRPMGSFPLSLIPTFLVPLFLIFHLIALAQLRVHAAGSAFGPDAARRAIAAENRPPMTGGPLPPQPDLYVGAPAAGPRTGLWETHAMLAAIRRADRAGSNLFAHRVGHIELPKGTCPVDDLAPLELPQPNVLEFLAQAADIEANPRKLSRNGAHQPVHVKGDEAGKFRSPLAPPAARNLQEGHPWHNPPGRPATGERPSRPPALRAALPRIRT